MIDFWGRPKGHAAIQSINCRTDYRPVPGMGRPRAQSGIRDARTPRTRPMRPNAGRFEPIRDRITIGQLVRFARPVGSAVAVRFWCGFSRQTPTFEQENSSTDARFPHESRQCVGG